MGPNNGAGDDGRRKTSGPGMIGLENLGNTCFMNAGLQCLCHIEPFAAYFLEGNYKAEINRDNPMGSKGELATAFAELSKSLWRPDAKRAFDPTEFHEAVSQCAPHLFEYGDQQDVQEFLAFCLDGLHEDLNLVTTRGLYTEEMEKEDARKCEGKSEEFAAALSWMRYLERGKSFLVDLFQGQLRSSLACTLCDKNAARFEPFLYLSVPVEKGMVSVTDAIEKYLKEELLTDDERWLCPRCNCKVDAKKKIEVWKLPPVLVLHLKRFEFDAKSMEFKKIRATLKAPFTLDLSSYVSSPQRESATYDVVAVANHHGSFDGGHYTSYCQANGESGEHCQWYHFDDGAVRPMKEDAEVVTKDAYVIFLVRRRSGAAKHVKRQTVTLPELWPHWVSTRNSVMLDLVPARAAKEVD